MAKTNSYKKVIAGTMTAAMVAGVVSPVAAAGKTFPDVDGHWSKESVYYLVDKGAIAGNPDGTFAPDREVTRAEAATMMAKILNLPIDNDAKPSYADSKAHWATPIIAAVEKAGVIKGKGDGTFDPDGKIDRVSMASLLVEAYKLDTKVNGTPATKFKDLETLNWGKEKANILVELGISVGTGDKWEPNKTVTKAEAAQFIAKTDKQFGTAAVTVESAKAVTTKKVEVKFNKAVEKLTKEDVKVANKANNDKVLVTDVKLSDDKKSATVELADALAAKQAYTVEVNKAGKADVVVGSLEPKTIEIADQTVVAKEDIKADAKEEEKPALQYSVKDENGTTITLPEGFTVEFVSPAQEGTFKSDGKVELSQGTSTTVKVVIKKDKKVVIESKEVKVSAQNEAVAEISNWTVAKDSVKFDKDFKQNNVVYAGEELKVQAQLKDQFGKEVTASPKNVQFESLNTDVVVVDKTTGKVTVMGNGKATVKITAKTGDKVVATKNVELDVRAAKAVKEIKVDQASLALSTKDTTGLTVKATVLDQYGNPVKDATVKAKVKGDKQDVTLKHKDNEINTETALTTNDKGVVELNVTRKNEVTGTYTVEVTTKDKNNKDLTATFTVDLKVPGVFAKYDVRGLEAELDKNKKNEDTKHNMNVSVLSVDANGLALGDKEVAKVVVKDKEGNVVQTSANVQAELLDKGTYKVEVSVNEKLVKTHELKVVDSQAPTKVEFTSTNLQAVAPGADMKEALAGILAIDGTRATAADVTDVKYVSSDEEVVEAAKTGKAKAAGTTTIFVQELTVKSEKVEFKEPVKVTVTVK
ncbi:S-layer protein [Bacillus wiedmannii]|uniref:S-layer homology domain-containing protein n=1 Tax=Bacillus wiedmannii TaxID=1890302 RepID=UPI000E732343|nr:S-layer protein [Bacillus wiedmannii]